MLFLDLVGEEYGRSLRSYMTLRVAEPGSRAMAYIFQHRDLPKLDLQVDRELTLKLGRYSGRPTSVCPVWMPSRMTNKFRL